jgi:predicted ATPase
VRIKKLWIERFKNLRDFSIPIGDYLTTVLIGQNGTGKSNLLEAVAIIFRDLDLELENRDSMPFEYHLEYDCRGRQIEIDANPSQTRLTDGSHQLPAAGPSGQRRARLLIKVDGTTMSMKDFFGNKREYLPNHTFGYYSGPTNRLAQHFHRHQQRFYDEQRRGEERPLRPLFFALPVHSQFVLLAYYAFPDSSELALLHDYLGVGDLDSVLFVITEPDWKRVDSSKDPFWGATGIPREVLQILYDEAQAPSRQRVRVRVGPGKTVSQEHLFLYIKDVQTLRRVAKSRGGVQEFFKDLDTLYISRLISEVRIGVRRLGSEDIITFAELSEGEQQLLTVLGLVKFTRQTESLFLLDEPDTHLNPAWKLDYLRLIEPLVGADTRCQILLATHDPIVMGSCLKEQVRVLAFAEGRHTDNIICYEPDEDPRGMGVAALLTSDVFGLRSALDWVTQEKLDQKRALAAKDPSELTEEELERLRELNSELDGLGFTYSFRDPLYQEFQQAMMRELEKRRELVQPVLTKGQQTALEELAREIVAELTAQPRSEG